MLVADGMTVGQMIRISVPIFVGSFVHAELKKIR